MGFEAFRDLSGRMSLFNYLIGIMKIRIIRHLWYFLPVFFTVVFINETFISQFLQVIVAHIET